MKYTRQINSENIFNLFPVPEMENAITANVGGKSFTSEPLISALPPNAARTTNPTSLISLPQI
jgi:hypothetical protein